MEDFYLNEDQVAEAETNLAEAQLELKYRKFNTLTSGIDENHIRKISANMKKACGGVLPERFLDIAKYKDIAYQWFKKQEKFEWITPDLVEHYLAWKVWDFKQEHKETIATIFGQFISSLNCNKTFKEGYKVAGKVQRECNKLDAKLEGENLDNHLLQSVKDDIAEIKQTVNHIPVAFKEVCDTLVQLCFNTLVEQKLLVAKPDQPELPN